ncbi:MAG: DUF2961 domain-containing protein [Planctomycetaceae bacterium]|jgi:hypothetical protein|nr:DUF2961 domain-containing protein [Planctomycetaceae bacterium]
MLKQISLSVLLLTAVTLHAQTVSLSSLLDEMVDYDAVTRFPEPAFVCVQASSYDRASKSPNENWFANNDASQFIRDENVTAGGVERKEWVLMDADGPGAIVRFWITSHHYKSTLRVYLDGNTTPAIEANVGDVVGGKFLVDSPLSEENARGRNLYLPIPYAKHCKVTVDDMPTQKNLYYQINYRNYAKGTNIETFTLDNFKSLVNKVETTKKKLLSAGDNFVNLTKETPKSAFVVPKGSSVLLHTGKVTIPSGAAFQQIVIKVDAEGEKLVQALRSTVLSIKFDGKETVWCPLGDFFGGGVGINPYKSWYSRVEKDGTLISLWRMPFQKSFEVSLINYGTEDVKVTNSIKLDEYKWNKRSMYFHANWHQQREIETIGGNGTVDWNYAKLCGKGVFAGDALSVLNRDPAWWGEGDEKIYVDNESFPSHFGTGTEDYYGYAWCTPEFFESPFHFQPRAEGPNNYGNTTNGRVRLLDTIPFTTDFRFDMEVWHWAKTKIDYSVVTFWYGFEQTTTDVQNRSEQVKEVQSPVVYNTPMSLNIPGFKIEKLPTGGRIQVQGMSQYTTGKWDNNDHLWWTDGQPGNRLELLFDVEKDSKYKLVAKLTKARDYGIAQFYINGKKIGEPIDLYNPEVVPTGEIVIGTTELKTGCYPITVVITGKNANADAKYMIGIDTLQLITVE